jgi:hypothetical protein
MKSTTTARITAIAAAAVLSLGAAGSAQARHGADDPAGHQRHGRGADDAQPHAKRGADDRAGHRHHGRRHHRHGSDDVQPHA